MYFVYILKSLKDGTFYKGQTENIDKRLEEHNRGKCSATRNKLPWMLVHVEICSSRNEAREVEKFFKSGYGREIIKEIVN